MFYVYLLKWTKFYLWVTNDINIRYQQYLDWKVYSTKRMWSDLKLIWYLECGNRESALKVESSLKRSWHVGRISDYEWFVSCF